MLHRHIAHLVDICNQGFCLLSKSSQSTEIFTEDLHGNIRFGACDQLVEPKLNGLGKLKTQALEYGELLFHHRGQFLAVFGIYPFLLGFEDYHDVCFLHRHRIGGYLGGTNLGDHMQHFRELILQALFHLGGIAQTFLQTTARWQCHLYRQVALFKLGNELLT